MVCKRVDWLCLPTPKGSNYIIPTNNFRYFVTFNTFSLSLYYEDIYRDIYGQKIRLIPLEWCLKSKISYMIIQSSIKWFLFLWRQSQQHAVILHPSTANLNCNRIDFDRWTFLSLQKSVFKIINLLIDTLITE